MRTVYVPTVMLVLALLVASGWALLGIALSALCRHVPSQLAGHIDKTLSHLSSVFTDASPQRQMSNRGESSDAAGGRPLQSRATGAPSRTIGASEMGDGAVLCWKVLPSPRAAAAPSPLSRLELLHQHHADKSVQQQEHALHDGGDRPHADETREELLRKLERYESARSVSQHLDFSMAPASVADESWLSLPESLPPRTKPGNGENGLAGRVPRKESPPPWVIMYNSRARTRARHQREDGCEIWAV